MSGRVEKSSTYIYFLKNVFTWTLLRSFSPKLQTIYVSIMISHRKMRLIGNENVIRQLPTKILFGTRMVVFDFFISEGL